MAEGFAKQMALNNVEVYSAGTERYEKVKPLAVEVMKEVGVDISKQFPKLLSEIPESVDFLITMGCNVVCPFVPSEYIEDWGLEDPSGKGIEAFRITREAIRIKVEMLLKKLSE